MEKHHNKYLKKENERLYKENFELFLTKKLENGAEVKIKDNTIIVKIENPEFNFYRDGRLTYENLLKYKKSGFEWKIYTDIKEIFMYEHKDTFIVNEKILKYEKIQIFYYDEGEDSKGNTKTYELAKININMEDFNELNLENIFTKDLLEILFDNMEFDFYGFHRGLN